MIERACDDPLLVFGWVTGDEACGGDTRLRRRCSGRGVNHVFAVSFDHPLVLGGAATSVDAPFAAVGEAAWQRRSCGDGAKGRRWYDRAWIEAGEQAISPVPGWDRMISAAGCAPNGPPPALAAS